MSERKPPTLGAEFAISLVSDRWVIMVVHALIPGKRRYAEMQRTIPSISKKMLTQTLRRLERDGLVSRKVFPVVPPHTEYELTALGRSMVPPLQALCRWGQQNIGEVVRSRTLFDERPPTRDQQDPSDTAQ